jgi:hypothetical protein
MLNGTQAYGTSPRRGARRPNSTVEPTPGRSLARRPSRLGSVNFAPSQISHVSPGAGSPCDVRLAAIKLNGTSKPVLRTALGVFSSPFGTNASRMNQFPRRRATNSGGGADVWFARTHHPGAASRRRRSLRARAPQQHMHVRREAYGTRGGGKLHTMPISASPAWSVTIARSSSAT